MISYLIQDTGYGSILASALNFQVTAGARLAVLLALQLPDCEEVYRSELNKNALLVEYVN